MIGNENGLIFQSSSSDASIHSEKSISTQAYVMHNCPVKGVGHQYSECLNKEANYFYEMRRASCPGKEERDDGDELGKASVSQRRVTFNLGNVENFARASIGRRDAMVQTDEVPALFVPGWRTQNDIYDKVYFTFLNSLISDSTLLPSEKMDALLARYVRMPDPLERKAADLPKTTCLDRIMELDRRLTQARRALVNARSSAL
uniref:Uncharacterized protein n=1 Tax=Trichuris muris TaxID=70415 RepID=A0A5S6QZB8_TRIMR